MMTDYDRERLAQTNYAAYATLLRAEIAHLDRLVAEILPAADTRETYEQMAERIAHEAPLALEALGVPAAFSKWKAAVAYVRELGHRQIEADIARLFNVTRLVAIEAYTEMHPELIPRDVIAEIDLQIQHDWKRVADRYFPIAFRLVSRARLDQYVREVTYGLA